jgi:phosphoribosylamine---glycine ligase
MLEGSKLFAKTIMERYKIPTAAHIDFTEKKNILEYIEGIKTYPIVIKLDGLAAGKGVGIPGDRKEAIDFVVNNAREDTKVFIEDFIDGEEASVLGVSDGNSILSFVAAQDHKRIFDGDNGPNTGGMGAYAPAPVVNETTLKLVHDTILQPTIDGMKKEGIPFKGILYAGLIIKGDIIKVLEFNARFGDPETQVILPLLNGKLGDLIQGSINGNLSAMNISFMDKHAISVVMSSGGYPGDYKKGVEIMGLDSVSNEIMIFHAGTKRENNIVYTNGGRVLNVTAIGNSLIKARQKVYDEIGRISFKGAHYRKDIAYRALK